jgi:non-ribosomal peptide synthetase component F
MLLLAAFQTLLKLYSGQEDILVGTPVAGRTLVETEALIGCFVNTLVMRGDLSGDPSLREVIKRTRETALGAYSHQEIPFEKLVEELRPKRSLNISPLFQVMFVVEDETKPELSLPGIQITRIPTATATSKFDFSLGVVEKPNGFDVWLSYSTDLFEAGSVSAMLDDYRLLLESIVADPAQRLSKLPTLGWKPRVWSVERTANAYQTGAENGSSQRSAAAREFVAPRTPIEERLAGIWSEVLKVKTVSAYDNFFELGGHSLLAAQVISRARNTFATELTLRRLFETPTIAGLAEAIYQMQTAATEDDELAAMLADLSQLSEEEVQQRIAEAS